MKHKYPAAAIFPHAPASAHEMLGHLSPQQTQNLLLYQEKQVHHTKALVLPQCTASTKQNTYFLISESRAGTKISQRCLLKARQSVSANLHHHRKHKPNKFLLERAGQSYPHYNSTVRRRAGNVRWLVARMHVFKVLFSPQHRIASLLLFADVRMRPLENK